MTATAVRRYEELTGVDAVRSFREYAMEKGINATEVNFKAWDLNHNNLAVERSFGMSNKELRERMLLILYRGLLDRYSTVKITAGKNNKNRVGMNVLRTFHRDNGENLRTWIDDPRVTSDDLERAMLALKSAISRSVVRMKMLGGSEEYIKQVVSEALEEALNRED